MKIGALLRGTIFAVIMVCTQGHAGELLDQNNFNDGIILPWNVSESEEANSDFALVNGEYVITLLKGVPNRWDTQTRHRGLTLQQGHTYTVTFKIRATKATKVYAKIGQMATPYKEYWNNNWNPFSIAANSPTTIKQTFTMNDATDATCEFAFHVGGDLVLSPYPIDIGLDDIYLSDPQYTKPIKPPPVPKPLVRVNQVGYLPFAQKHATVLSASTTPLTWTIKNGSGAAVASGSTTVFGKDEASGDTVHTIDFSSFTTPGKGYDLSVNVPGSNNTSHPFDVQENIYAKLKYDALAYFYHNRSGIEIKMPYCTRPDLARAAGHPSDIATTVEIPSVYTLDITGGWYDAGDHGKYVVNGGIAVWTMMNQYERAALRGARVVAPFADGSMNIPEKGNGIPDILDEGRWEMSMLLKMQVPVDKPMAGMVHHKMHDEKWTALATRPDQDLEKRIIKPPSTAATLNLAAVGATSSRIWKMLDPAFSKKCLDAAEIAWLAAIANPAKYALNTDKLGGGPYGDSCVTDDFYWAACELFVTTGKDVYKTYLQNSAYYLKMPTVFDVAGEDNGLTGAFTWGTTYGCGTITLAMVPNALASTEIAKARAAIAASSDYWIGIIGKEGYRVPIPKGAKGYPWGSNSFILNEALAMALAYDFTNNKKYLDGVSESMDYLLGRNAMDKAYVTGYGSDPVANPHHRFWAFQSNSLFPTAPAGAISGGPNSGLEDPWVRSAGILGTSAQKCYLDNIEAWSTNEVTINWNAPLAWVAAFLDEKQATSINEPHVAVRSANACRIQVHKNVLRASLQTPQKVSVVVSDISGRCVYKTNFGEGKEQSLALSLKSFARGVYTVSMHGTNFRVSQSVTIVN